MSSRTLDPVPTERVLRDHDRRVEAILKDPTLRDSQLLVALVFAWMVTHLPRDQWRLHVLANAIHPCPPQRHGPVWADQSLGEIRRVLWSDRLHYEPPLANGLCSAPVRGRDTECGRAGSACGASLTDPSSGTVRHRQACPRHVDWLHGVAARNRETLDALDTIPTPPPNRGGQISKHLPEVNWPVLWATCNPNLASRPAPRRALEHNSPTLIQGGGQCAPPRGGHLTLIIGTS